MKRLLALFFLAGLCACATVTPSLDGKGATDVAQRRERNYEVGVQQSVVVGDALVRARDFTESTTNITTMQASESFQLSGGMVTIYFQAGEQLPIVGERISDGVTYTVAQKDWYGIQVAPDGTIGPGVINGLGTASQVLMAYRFQATPSTARFTRSTRTDVHRAATGQNFEIVFNGIDGQAMHFQYREYTADDMARPAFFQDLSYPLGTQVIRFRSLVIDVANVNAERITYTVRSE